MWSHLIFFLSKHQGDNTKPSFCRTTFIGGWNNMLYFQSCHMIGIDLGIKLEELCALNGSFTYSFVVSAWLFMETTR